MALLGMVSVWARGAGRRLLAITVDHGLSPDSRDWSRRCEAAARAVGADWTECRWEGLKPVAGLPAAARRARHALIAQAARGAGAKVVLFAHTADDIAEADWMRARGSTLGRLREWSPSPVWPEGRGLMLLRPMLDEDREALRDGLRDQGRDWIEDPANRDVRFARSRARAALQPSHGGEGARPAQESDTDARGRGPAGVRATPLPLGEGLEMGRSVGASELAAVLLCASGQEMPPRGARLEALTVRIRSGEDFTATLSGARIEARVDRVRIGREPGEFRRRPPAEIALDAGVPVVWDGRYEITARESGWTVAAGLGRLNALSKADRSVAATVPAWARAALPVLIRDDGGGPVLAWRGAEVRALGPRRLALAGWGTPGETTQESDLLQTIHGETPPPDLF